MDHPMSQRQPYKMWRLTREKDDEYRFLPCRVQDFKSGDVAISESKQGEFVFVVVSDAVFIGGENGEWLCSGHELAHLNKVVNKSMAKSREKVD